MIIKIKWLNPKKRIQPILFDVSRLKRDTNIKEKKKMSTKTRKQKRHYDYDYYGP